MGIEELKDLGTFEMSKGDYDCSESEIPLLCLSFRA